MDWLHRTLQFRIASLRIELDEAQKRILNLEAHILTTTNPDADAYREVGLSPNCSPVVLNSARKALLSHFHPDRWSEDRKPHATKCFQDAQAAFERIEALRQQGQARG
jgi:hypothetical protein